MASICLIISVDTLFLDTVIVCLACCIGVFSCCIAFCGAAAQGPGQKLTSDQGPRNNEAVAVAVAGRGRHDEPAVSQSKGVGLLRSICETMPQRMGVCCSCCCCRSNVHASSCNRQVANNH